MTAHQGLAPVRVGHALIWLMLLCSTWPLLTLVLRALAPVWFFPDLLPTGAGRLAWTTLRSIRVMHAGATSVSLAIATGLGATVGALIVARGLHRAPPASRRIATVLMFVPVIAPPVAVAVGVQVLSLQLGVAGRWLGVWMAHLIPAVGYVTLYFMGALSLDDASIEDAARTLGANRWQRWRLVVLPSMQRRLAEGAILGALVSWGQLSLTLIVGGGAVRTLPVEMLSIIRAGDDYVASLMALLLTAPPLALLSVTRQGAARTGLPTT